MKFWGTEYHLMVATDASAVYAGDYEDDLIVYYKWNGYVNGVNKIVSFTHDGREGTFLPKEGNRQFYRFVVVEVTTRFFHNSYTILGPASQFYMWLPKDERESCRQLWENKDDRKKRTSKKKSV